jgi:hypothetical protein
MQRATQMMIGGVRLTNVSQVDCTLNGAPRITLIAKDGRTMPARLTRVRGFSAFGLTRWPGYPLVALRPGQSATAPFFWGNYCDHQPGPARFRIMSSHFTITIPARGGTDTPICQQPQSPSTLTVGTFLPSERQGPSPRPLPLRVSITAPHQARPARPFHYQVTLTNYTKHPVVFHRCPAYWQGLATNADHVTKVRRALVLNCRPTPVIPPGGHATYAMQYTIPTTASAGANALVWTFEPIGRGGGGKTLLTIR